MDDWDKKAWELFEDKLKERKLPPFNEYAPDTDWKHLCAVELGLPVRSVEQIKRIIEEKLVGKTEKDRKEDVKKPNLGPSSLSFPRSEPDDALPLPFSWFSVIPLPLVLLDICFSYFPASELVRMAELESYHWPELWEYLRTIRRPFIEFLEVMGSHIPTRKQPFVTARIQVTSPWVNGFKTRCREYATLLELGGYVRMDSPVGNSVRYDVCLQGHINQIDAFPWQSLFPADMQNSVLRAISEAKLFRPSAPIDPAAPPIIEIKRECCVGSISPSKDFKVYKTNSDIAEKIKKLELGTSVSDGSVDESNHQIATRECTLWPHSLADHRSESSRRSESARVDRLEKVVFQQVQQQQQQQQQFQQFQQQLMRLEELIKRIVPEPSKRP